MLSSAFSQLVGKQAEMRLKYSQATLTQRAHSRQRYVSALQGEEASESGGQQTKCKTFKVHPKLDFRSI